MRVSLYCTVHIFIKLVGAFRGLMTYFAYSRGEGC